jgi:hypothetical protein
MNQNQEQLKKEQQNRMQIKQIVLTGSFALATFAFLAGCAVNQQDNTLGAIAIRLGVPFQDYWKDWTPSGDVDGKVGYPLSIKGPRTSSSGDWSADFVGIDSGQLPPGLSVSEIGGRRGDISGIPTERGHWVVTMKISNLRLNGHLYTVEGAPDVLVENQGWKNYDDCVEGGRGYCRLTTIRFHITGSGEVH